MTTTTRRPPAAAAILEQSLGRFRGDLTVADAAARGGLPLRDAEDGLRHLAGHRGGHLKATEKGELIYSFPAGLVQPPQARWGRRLLRGVGRALAGVGRFVVRAWVSVVLVGYALVFLALLIALASRDDDGDGVSGALALVGRVLFEALFWTFHPFSPLALGLEPGWMRARARRPRIPFYERVNRFVFGPPRAVIDPRLQERTLVAEIRRLDGRVGPEDVMRVTGLDREGAERELLRLVVDYQGDIQVSDAGAILYVFGSLRSTAGASGAALPAEPIWNERAVVRPVTGNGMGTNGFLVALNGFNLGIGAVAIAGGLTLERVVDIVTRAGADPAFSPPPVPHGVPLLLGWIPFLFSAALFVLPIGRLLSRRREAARVAAENGRRALLRMSLAAPEDRPEIAAPEAARGWAAAAARPADARRIEAAVQGLGGDVDITADGAVVYRFETGARERRALADARAAAAATEALPGRVVFSSDEN